MASAETKEARALGQVEGLKGQMDEKDDTIDWLKSMVPHTLAYPSIHAHTLSLATPTTI